MIPQFINRVMSSFSLMVDHYILSSGEAFTNYGSYLYDVRNNFSNIYTYGLPFKQIVSDFSVPNANIMTGVYIDGTAYPTGSNNLIDINYAEGQVYFSADKSANTLSGNYAVKDFNVYLTNEADYKILFETKHTVQARTSQSLTGLVPESQTLPAIYIINQSMENVPFAFGGLDTTTIPIRVIILADNGFKLDAVKSILADRARTFVPVLETSDMPFNHYGGFNGTGYNYKALESAAATRAYISKVKTSHLSYTSVILPEVTKLMPGIFPAVADFTLEIQRTPR